MILALAALAVHRTCVLRKSKRSWYHDQAFQVAVALIAFILGSCLRAGYIWLLLHCDTFDRNCGWIQGRSWVMTIAGMLAIVGGLCVVRVLSPESWRPWVWLGAGIGAMAIPAAYYLAA